MRKWLFASWALLLVGLWGLPSSGAWLKGTKRALFVGAPAWVLSPNGVPATVDLNFVSGLGWNNGVGGSVANFITTSRASSGANLLPTSASGYAYSTFGNNLPRITPGLGLLVEESRTNQLLNSTAPATQTTGSLGTGTYTLWVNGAGTATMSAGTGTGCGTGAATQGTPVNFTISVAGTCTVTVSGSLNAFQLELGAFGTSLIVTAGATATRAADVPTVAPTVAYGSAWTMYVSGTPYFVPVVASTPVALDLTTGSTSNEAGLLVDRTSGKIDDLLTVGGSSKYNSTLSNTVYAPAVMFKAATALAAGTQASTVAGSTPTTHSAASIFTPTAINIGNRVGGGQQLDGYVSRIAIWPTVALSNSALQSITGGSGP